MFLSNKQEEGQGLVEYALILVLVSVVVLGVLLILGPIIGNVFTEINSTLTTNGGGGGVASPSHSAWCNYYSYPSGQTLGPYANDIVLMTTSGGFTATLWADDPAMNDPSTQWLK